MSKRGASAATPVSPMRTTGSSGTALPSGRLAYRRQRVDTAYLTRVSAAEAGASGEGWCHVPGRRWTSGKLTVRHGMRLSGRRNQPVEGHAGSSRGRAARGRRGPGRHRRQQVRAAGRPVLRRARNAAGWARIRGRCGGGGGQRAAGEPVRRRAGAPSSGARRAAGGGTVGRRGARVSRRCAGRRRRDRNGRQDHHGALDRGCARRRRLPHRPGLHGRGPDARGAQPGGIDHARRRGAPADVVPHACGRSAGHGYGGVLARRRPAPHRRRDGRRRRVHQPQPGTPRLPRHRRAVLRDQSGPVHPGLLPPGGNQHR